MSHEPHPDHDEIQSVVETANLSAIEAVNRKLIDLVDRIFDENNRVGFKRGYDGMYSRILSSVRGGDETLTERIVSVSRDMYADPSVGIYYTFEYAELITEKDEQLISERRTTWSMDPDDIEHAIVEEKLIINGGEAKLKELAGKRGARLEPDAMDMRQGEVWPNQADVELFSKLVEEVNGE